MAATPLVHPHARIPHRPARRLLALAVVVLSLCSAVCAQPAAAALTSANWDSAQQRQVLAAGLMSNSGSSFAGASALSATQANAAIAALAVRLQSAEAEQSEFGQLPPAEQVGGAAAQPAGSEAGAAQAPTPAPAPVLAQTQQNPVTVVGFDSLLVQQLGLADMAAHVQTATAAAGLHPPAYFGSEVVARFLELRYEHPVGSQRLDLFPTNAITRAEAAWSLAAAANISAWQLSSAREALSTFQLPAMSAAQRQALQIAVSRIGYPYVWGGTTDNTADGLEHGGFDCSGFAWRVYKVSGLPWGVQIKGRTAAEQGGEIPKARRLRASELQPGDLLFFGTAHFNSRATNSNVIHEGIYLGDNWVIHSSGQGVYVLPLTGSWLGSSFAWGRRVIG